MEKKTQAEDKLRNLEIKLEKILEKSK